MSAQRCTVVKASGSWRRSCMKIRCCGIAVDPARHSGGIRRAPALACFLAPVAARVLDTGRRWLSVSHGKPSLWCAAGILDSKLSKALARHGRRERYDSAIGATALKLLAKRLKASK